MHLKYTFQTMELDDRIVAVPVGTNSAEFQGVVKLNETAARIFELLKDEITTEVIVKKLAKEYDCPENVLEKDVQKYIAYFQEEGLLA